MKKEGKAKTCAFRCQFRIFCFHRISSAWTAKPVLTHAPALWEPVKPLADGFPPPAHQAAMGNYLPPQPPWFVGKVLGNGQPPDEFVGDLSAQLQVIDDEGRPLLLDMRSRQGIHTYLGILAVRVDSAPGTERLALLMVDQDGEVHVLHSFFSVSVRPYYTESCFLAFRGDITPEGLPPIANIPVDSLLVQCAFSAVPREDHVVHIEEIPPLEWQTMPCEMAGSKEYGQDLSCRGLTFLPLDAATCLLGAPRNMAEASQILSPLLVSRAPPYKEALDWL